MIKPPASQFIMSTSKSSHASWWRFENFGSYATMQLWLSGPKISINVYCQETPPAPPPWYIFASCLGTSPAPLPLGTFSRPAGTLSNHYFENSLGRYKHLKAKKNFTHHAFA